MTIGQRIASLRKEHNFSQEALGEQLGVSRQSIYKWESDAALPEIDKLIALSRLFGVSVGWLLGVEEESTSPGTDSPTEDTPDLTEAQLKMVQEIADRYIAAQPQPAPRKKWPWVLAALVLIAVFFSLFSRLRDLNHQYNNLQNSVYRIDQSVGNQINGISSRVEEILKQQNNLTAEYNVEHLSDDYAANTALFSAWAVPKTYVNGMTAAFVADSGNGTVHAAAAEHDRKFSAEITAELTDMISLSVVFTYPDGTMQTQLLNSFDYLYSNSLPIGDLQDELMWAALTNGKLVFPSPDAAQYVQFIPTNVQGYELVADVRIGLFKNQQLVTWAEPCPIPDSFIGFDEFEFYQFPDMEIPMTPDDMLRCGAVVTDIYGRVTVFPGTAYTSNAERTALEWTESDWDTDPAGWHY